MTDVEPTSKRAVWKYLAILCSCVAIGGLALWLLQPDPKPLPPTPTPSQAAINIGIPINDSPGFSSSKDGQRNGFDIDLANFIADGLGRHPNFVPITVDSREQNLKK